MKTIISGKGLMLGSLICCAVAASIISATSVGRAASTVSDQYSGLTSDRDAAQVVDYTVEPYQLFNGAAPETTLFTFPSNTTGGCYPTGTLLRDAAGALYGSTTGCPITQTNTVFRLTPRPRDKPHGVLQYSTTSRTGAMAVSPTQTSYRAPTVPCTAPRRATGSLSKVWYSG